MRRLLYAMAGRGIERTKIFQNRRNRTAYGVTSIYIQFDGGIDSDG